MARPVASPVANNGGAAADVSAAQLGHQGFPEVGPGGRRQDLPKRRVCVPLNMGAQRRGGANTDPSTRIMRHPHRKQTQGNSEEAGLTKKKKSPRGLLQQPMISKVSERARCREHNRTSARNVAPQAAASHSQPLLMPAVQTCGPLPQPNLQVKCPSSVRSDGGLKVSLNTSGLNTL